MKYIIQVHLEHKEDVIREIEIPTKKSLEDLHHTIIKSFNLENNEMASFYETNEKLELIREIPIFQIDDSESSISKMNEISIEKALSKKNNHLIYIYDFLKMWRFLISFIKTSEDKSQEIKLAKSIGEMPKDAPEIIFQADKDTEDRSEDIYGGDDNEEFYDPNY